MTLPAERYAALLTPRHLREEELLRVERRLPEIEIQARWFAGEFGSQFQTADGDPVSIIQFGVWNREAGPDFAEAAVQMGGQTLHGAIEIDSEPRDWEAHGHSTNPDYEGVILHVCCRPGPQRFFIRTASNRHIPQILLDFSRLDDDPPSAVPAARPGRCCAPLRDAGDEKARTILEAAAMHRLKKKSQRLARLAELHGRDEALFQAVAGALGYKHNKLPFTLLAQRLPLRTLQQAPAEALLFGAAGFLSEPDLSQFDPSARAHLRELWEQWWPRRTPHERLLIPPSLWRLAGVRPVNHPQRRLAALAAFVRHWPTLRKFAAAPDARAFQRFCFGLHHEYWDFHYTTRSASTARRMALVGRSRATDILANVLFPIAFATEPDCWEAYRALPAPLSNRRAETAAIRLFGSTPPRGLLNKVILQQGLLQIYEDFCMRDATDCARCRFPGQLERW